MATRATLSTRLNMGNNLSSPDILNKRKRSATSDAKAALPEPIKSLLNELYLRGPATVGIFRKSPNAKDCRELRQKLETDCRSSIEQFQVNVIASVFKVSYKPPLLLLYLFDPYFTITRCLLSPRLLEIVFQSSSTPTLSSSASSFF